MTDEEFENLVSLGMIRLANITEEKETSVKLLDQILSNENMN
ncbi:MAG: hypothetical protein ACLTXM_00535 [Enterococcus sp.]